MVQQIYYNQQQEEENRGALDWWKGTEPHKGIFQWIKVVQTNQTNRRLNYTNFQKLYLNRDYQSLTVTPSAVPMQQPIGQVSWNIIKCAVDTLTNKISKVKPRPIFLTEDGDWKKQQQAKKLTQFLDGLFQSAKVYEVGRDVFRDAAITGTGGWRLLICDDKIEVERVLMKEIFIDEVEAKYGKPRQIHQLRTISRSVLLDMYGDDPAAKFAIEAVPRKVEDLSNRSYTNDVVEVVESWHLRSGKNTADGKHTITIENFTLVDEEYKKDYFPFVFFHWTNPLEGFYGSGIGEELYSTQLEIAKTLRNIQLAQHLVAVPRVYINSAAQVVNQHINNTIGAVIKYTGQPPIFTTPTAMNPEVYQHLIRLWDKGFEQVGITQMSATGQKPAGLDAGVALRTYRDIETERFATVAQRWDEAFLQIASCFVDMADDLYTENKSLKLLAGDKFLSTIDWGEIDITKEDYTMRLFPTNILPATPEGKFQRVSEMVRDQLIDPQTAKRLLDFPDIEAELTLQTASDDLILKCISQIVEKGQYEPPTEFMNLERALQYAQNAYLKYKTQGLPEDKLEMIDRWSEEVYNMSKVMQPPPPPVQPVSTQQPPMI